MRLNDIKRERTRLTRDRDSAQRVLDAYNKELLGCESVVRAETWLSGRRTCGSGSIRRLSERY